MVQTEFIRLDFRMLYSGARSRTIGIYAETRIYGKIEIFEKIGMLWEEFMSGIYEETFGKNYGKKFRTCNRLQDL